jgi:aminoglycoside 3-N-acetyltransferase I
MIDSLTPAAQVRRLHIGDRDVATSLFAMMGEVFGEAGEPLRDAYVELLLRREEFWVIAALVGDEVVGGLTAHALPMTRSESSEVFVYDVAVRDDWQRRGIGRQLMSALCEAAAGAGLGDVFVPADTSDVHALDFYRALGGESASVTMFTFPNGRR